MKAAIRQFALELGFGDCRFTTAAPPESGPKFQNWLASGQHGEMGYLQRNAGKRTNPQLVLPGAKSVICLAVSYGQRDECRVTRDEVRESDSRHTSPATRHGLIARYAHFADYHEVLGERLQSLAVFVNEHGGIDTRSLWYLDTGPVLERDFAQRAGTGFVGKHTNVISRKLGNWIFLAEILTTVEIEPDEPEKNRCGSCVRCLTACPTRAITAPFQLDARRCISYLTIELKGSIPVELRPLIGNRIYGCDDCLAACPWNRFAREGNLMKPHARDDLMATDLTGLLKLDDAGFKKQFAGTPMLRTKRRGLLRNVCVALGNVGDETVLAALQQVSDDSEPLIAEHARWAVAQVTTRHLSAR